MDLSVVDKTTMIDKNLLILIGYVSFNDTLKPEQTVIEAEINSNIRRNTIFSSITIGTMLFLSLPLYFLLNQRLPLHSKVYDLFASVKS
jgi:hypothetical protein